MTPTAEELRAAAERAPYRLLEAIKHLSKFPTQRNQCYATGYVSGCADSGAISCDDCRTWLAVTNNIEVMAPTVRALTK